MEFVKALSQCWWLGNQCVPDWTGWATAIACVGVIATVGLGLATYGLGVAAKNASHAALAISEKSDQLQDDDRSREAAVILQFLRAEFVWTASRISAFHKCLDGEESTCELDKSQRKKLSEMVRMLEMPETQSLMSRLHVLGDADARLVAAVLGDARLYCRLFDGFTDPDFNPDISSSLTGFTEKAPGIEQNLRKLAASSAALRNERRDVAER